MELFKQLEMGQADEFYAVIDQKVKSHLPVWIQNSSQVWWLTHPEEQKNLQHYSQVVEFFLKLGLNRTSKLHAVGGGATTDLGGFVAATMLRGICWIAVPTTLLAMIDGAIGGKVAVNMPQGKNLIGAFHAPEKILICPDFLSTLPEGEWLSGKGEMLKYGFLSKSISQQILADVSMEDLALACAEFKAELVEQDFKEQGDRIHLNLGHTLGHAFESALKIPHGQAVIMGMKYLFMLMDQQQALHDWQRMVMSLGLNANHFDLKHFPQFKLTEFLNFLEQDKKKTGRSLRLILVREIGSCYVQEITLESLKQKIRASHDFNH